MCKIELLYIDDNIEPSISEYFAEKLCKTSINGVEIKINYEEFKFNKNNNYVDILNNDKIINANLIIIDSRLFENSKVGEEKLSGEEFKIMLKKLFPFKEVIVISQNEENLKEFQILRKFLSSHKDNNSIEFYEKNWKNIISKKIEEIIINQNIFSKLKSNKNIDKYLIEKIEESIEGKEKYKELTKNDIDDIIIAFKKIQENYNAKK